MIDPQAFFKGATTNIKEQTYQIAIRAPADGIWRLVEDEDGSLLPRPGQEAHWVTRQDGVELAFTLVRKSLDRLTCVVREILRPDPFCLVTRMAGQEIMYLLIPGTTEQALVVTYRWDETLKLDRTRIAESVAKYLSTLKAAAESQAVVHDQL